MYRQDSSTKEEPTWEISEGANSFCRISWRPHCRPGKSHLLKKILVSLLLLLVFCLLSLFSPQQKKKKKFKKMSGDYVAVLFMGHGCFEHMFLLLL